MDGITVMNRDDLLFLLLLAVLDLLLQLLHEGRRRHGGTGVDDEANESLRLMRLLRVTVTSKSRRVSLYVGKCTMYTSSAVFIVFCG